MRFARSIFSNQETLFLFSNFLVGWEAAIGVWLRKGTASWSDEWNKMSVWNFYRMHRRNGGWYDWMIKIRDLCSPINSLIKQFPKYFVLIQCRQYWTSVWKWFWRDSLWRSQSWYLQNDQFVEGYFFTFSVANYIKTAPKKLVSNPHPSVKIQYKTKQPFNSPPAAPTPPFQNSVGTLFDADARTPSCLIFAGPILQRALRRVRAAEPDLVPQTFQKGSFCAARQHSRCEPFETLFWLWLFRSSALNPTTNMLITRPTPPRSFFFCIFTNGHPGFSFNRFSLTFVLSNWERNEIRLFITTYKH